TLADRRAAGRGRREPGAAAVGRPVDPRPTRHADPAVLPVDDPDVCDVRDRIGSRLCDATSRQLREAGDAPGSTAVRRQPKAVSVDRPGDAALTSNVANASPEHRRRVRNVAGDDTDRAVAADDDLPPARQSGPKYKADAGRERDRTACEQPPPPLPLTRLADKRLEVLELVVRRWSGWSQHVVLF